MCTLKDIVTNVLKKLQGRAKGKLGGVVDDR
jgi:hypothetical protein